MQPANGNSQTRQKKRNANYPCHKNDYYIPGMGGNYPNYHRNCSGDKFIEKKSQKIFETPCPLFKIKEIN